MWINRTKSKLVQEAGNACRVVWLMCIQRKKGLKHKLSKFSGHAPTCLGKLQLRKIIVNYPFQSKLTLSKDSSERYLSHSHEKLGWLGWDLFQSILRKYSFDTFRGSVCVCECVCTVLVHTLVPDPWIIFQGNYH